MTSTLGSGYNRVYDFQFVKEVTVTSAGVTDIDFTGLDISKDYIYKIILIGGHSGGGGAPIYLYINGDTTLANYATKYVHQNVGALTIMSTASPLVSVFAFNKGYSEIMVSSSVDITSYYAQTTFGNFGYFCMHSGYHTTTPENVTSLKLQCNNAPVDWAVGTVARLYKLVR